LRVYLPQKAQEAQRLLTSLCLLCFLWLTAQKLKIVANSERTLWVV